MATTLKPPTTPKWLTAPIKAFLRVAGLRSRPEFLPFTEASPEYRPGYCLSNCHTEQERTGRNIVYGWLIWEHRRSRFIEAEFHAVVEQGGELLDITPRRDGERLVLFVRDPLRTAEKVGQSVWSTWTNIKSRHERLIERTRPIEIQDTQASLSR